MVNTLSYTALEKALGTLKQATTPSNLLERDGAIKRFEYTFEICWKLIRKKLLTLGKINVSSSPKPLLRDALTEGWISNIETWFKFLEARNASSHEYEPLTADEVFKVIPGFIVEAENLLLKLKLP